MQQSYAPRGEQIDQRSSGRVYAVTTQDLVPAPSDVRGTFLFCNSVANVLIDTGASHSFVSAAIFGIGVNTVSITYLCCVTSWR